MTFSQLRCQKQRLTASQDGSIRAGHSQQLAVIEQLLRVELLVVSGLEYYLYIIARVSRKSFRVYIVEDRDRDK